jgi:uncharacterized protein (TIGR00255 family)
MISSMTGFGRAEKTFGDKTFLVEIKALNGKQLDIQMKLPPLLRPYEFDIRNILQEQLLRGSVECYINVKQNGTSKPVVINTDLIKSYYQQISALADELQMDKQSVLGSLLRLPEVVTPANEVISAAEFNDFSTVLMAAVEELKAHRQDEGNILLKDLLTRIEKIKQQEEKILELAPQRMARMKEELQQLMTEHVGKENIDQNRMEQELIYYIEKIDIHEEQIRLRQHCEYFDQVLRGTEESKGKKLSFIIQEMGREINTTGSKAYDADIQKSVVIMKDELEKAKEQILNVL